MTYYATLIIPFRFDCRMGGISEIDARIVRQGIWRRANYGDPNAVHTVADIYNSGDCAAVYTADGSTLNSLFGSRDFIVAAGQEKFPYSYGNLTMLVFSTGSGFLCTELSVHEATALRRLRTVSAGGIKHYKKTGRDSREELPMTALVKRLLDFCEHQTFFASPHPNSFTQAGMMIYAYNDGERESGEVLDEIFANTGEYIAKRLTPFQGTNWGISANVTALVTDPSCRIASTQLRSSMTHNYLPLIALALHQKAAAFLYAEAIRTQNGRADRLRGEITAFRDTFFPDNVSDAPIKQQIYSEVRRLNPAEMAPLQIFLADSGKGSSFKERIIGAISLIFSVGSIFSILSDGINVIQQLVPENMVQITRYGLYGICAAFAVLGIYGVYLIFKPSKK